MARYIDADLFKKNIKIVTPDVFANCDNCGLYDDIDIKTMINNTPTADVQEVKHGHWYCVEISENKWWNTCSVCKDTWQDDEGKIAFDYCPTCGAKMDEEVSQDV